MSTHSEFIPRPDEEFDSWQSNFINVVTANAVAWGIPVINPDLVALINSQTDWTAKFAAGKKANNPNHVQVVAKQTSREAYEPAIRLFNKRYLVSNAVITDENRAALGTNIPDRVRTRAGVPDFAPTGHVIENRHLFHKIRIENPTTPGSVQFPAGVKLARVYRALSDQYGVTPGPADFRLLGNANDATYLVNYTIDMIEHTAYYYLVYENTHGELGPEGTVFSAVIS